MSKYDELRADAKDRSENGHELMVAMVPTIISLLAERDALLASLKDCMPMIRDRNHAKLAAMDLIALAESEQ